MQQRNSSSSPRAWPSPVAVVALVNAARAMKIAEFTGAVKPTTQLDPQQYLRQAADIAHERFISGFLPLTQTSGNSGLEQSEDGNDLMMTNVNELTAG